MALTKAHNRMIEGAAVNVKDFGAVGDGVTDDTAAIQAAIDAVNAAGGGTIYFPEGGYDFTRLTAKSNVTLKGANSGAVYLICTDSSSTDAGVAFGSAIRAADNNSRVVRFGIEDMGIYAGSTSGVSAQQDIFQNVIGLNLCMCERTVIKNVGFGGWGYSAITLARADNGTEGLGFTTSAQDGNYNHIENVNFSSCGLYNPDKAAIWLKYKANSNKFYGVFAKGMTGSTLMHIEHGNDNLICGGAVESSDAGFHLGPMAVSNTMLQIRCESITGNMYEFDSGALTNLVLGGHYTSVGGVIYVDNDGSNRIIGEYLNNLRSYDFPPASSLSVFHNYGMTQVTGLNGDTDYPLYIKSPVYADPTKYPVAVLYNTTIATAATDIVGSIRYHNSDSSTGAAGVSAAVDAVLESSNGITALVFKTGTGTTLTENMRVKGSGVINMANLPTSSAGLVSGDLWNNAGVLNIVP